MAAARKPPRKETCLAASQEALQDACNLRCIIQKHEALAHDIKVRVGDALVQLNQQPQHLDAQQEVRSMARGTGEGAAKYRLRQAEYRLRQAGREDRRAAAGAGMCSTNVPADGSPG